MKLLTPARLEASLARCPSMNWGDGTGSYRPPNGYGLLRKPFGADADPGGSAGVFHYHTVGSQLKLKSSERAEKWQGACFAQWRHLASSHYLNKVTYRNPLGTFLTVPRGNDDFYRIAWDTVFQPCLPELPMYDELKTIKYLE